MTAELAAEDIGFASVSTSELSVEHGRRIAAVLDADDDLAAGDAIPLLWHWAFFTPSVPTGALGHDGHAPLPATGPTAGLPRRMWAGGRVHAHAPLALGQPATRRSRVASAERKEGRSGVLVVVTAAHEIEQGGQVVLTEEQDLVYRTPPDAPVETPVGDERLAAPDGGWADAVSVDPVMLFRYSAITFNSHRIHYDEPYATTVEGYPGLVVHGPLTATLLAESARRRGVQHASFTYRATAPVFASMPYTLVGEPAETGVALRAVRNDGAVAMTATLAGQ